MDWRTKHSGDPDGGRAAREEGGQHRLRPRPLRPHHHLLLQRDEDPRLLQELQPGRHVLPRHLCVGQDQLQVHMNDKIQRTLGQTRRT